MNRRQTLMLSRCCAAAILAASAVGCASLTDNNEAIIRVQASRNPAKAARLTLQGVKAMHDGEIDRAVEKFMDAVAADESYGPAHNNLGLLHYEQGNLYQAVLAFEQAMELMPHDPIVYYNLGLTLESAGKVHEALDLYWQAVEMDPANPNFLGNLVRLRVRMGEQDPDLIAQLQDLILIETRPDWRRWADRQLALITNETLDRGPETPDFNTGRNRSGNGTEPADKIIDLTPSDTPSSRDDASEPGDKKSSSNNLRLTPSREFNAPSVKSRPLPIQDTGSFEEIPPSIETSDYFR